MTAPRVLRALQGGLESMYRVETELDVRDFLVGPDRRGVRTARSPREQLLIKESYGEVEIGLFVDDQILANLEERDPSRKLDEKNLQDFLLVVEGVSHFVYVAHRARVERPVSAVELELQAEVDKYLVSLFVCWEQTGDPPEDLRSRLFEEVRFLSDLDREERDRYALANAAAATYAASLEARYLSTRSVEDLLSEARRFYRKGLAEKLAYISQLAA